MNRLLIKILILIKLFILLNFISPLSFAQNDELKIDKIIVNGEKRLSESFILNYLPNYPNTRFTNEVLDELIKNLYKTEFFSNIKLDVQGKILVINLEEFPISNQITFDSNNMVIGSYAGIFDGSSSFINLGDYDFLGNDPATTNSFSISTWCYFTDLESTNNSIITKWDNQGGQKSWYFGQYDQNFQSNSRNLHFAHSDNDGNETLAFSNNFAVTENNWHHCVLVWDGSTVKFYVDGINVGTVENNDFNEAVNNSSADLIIGARDQGTHEHFNGLIDQMRLIPRALNESEVLLLYQERFN